MIGAFTYLQTYNDIGDEHARAAIHQLHHSVPLEMLQQNTTIASCRSLRIESKFWLPDQQQMQMTVEKNSS